MEGNIYITGLIGSIYDEVGVELVDVIAQVKKQPDATSFNIHINSEGGVVDTGFDIFNYLKSLNVPLKTIGTGLVASIATVIFMAGDTRVLRQGTSFMVHLPMGGIDGTADEIESYSKEVKATEDRLIKFYSENVGLSKEAIQPLLKNETWLDSVKALELGFSNTPDLPMVAKAYFKEETKPNNNKMTKEDKSWIEQIFNKFMGPKIVNVMLQDANGATVEFPEIEEGQEITVGSKATVDGVPADGEYVMPDGKTYVFVGGELTEIKEAMAEVEETNDLQAELDALRLENEQLKTAKVEAETAVTNLKKEVTNFKSQIISRFDIDTTKDAKKEVKQTNLTDAQIMLNNLKNKKNK